MRRVRGEGCAGLLGEIIWETDGKIYRLKSLGASPNAYDYGGNLAYLDPEADTPFVKFLMRDTVGEAVSYFEQYLQTLHPKG